ALTTRFILPPLIGKTRTGFQPWFKPVTISKRQGIIAITLGLLFSAVIFSQQLPQWEKNLSSLSPLPDSYVQRDKQLRSMLSAGDLRYIALVQGDSMQQVLQKSEQLRPVLDRLAQENIIQHYDMAANYIPSQSLQNERRTILPTKLQLDENLSSALTDLPFKKDLFQPFIDDVEQTRKLPAIGFDDLQGMPFDLVVKSLLMQRAQGNFGIIHFSGLTNIDELMKQIASAQHDDVNAVSVHDLQQISSSLLIQFYADFLIRVVVAIFVIMLILLISLRHLARTLVVTSVLLLSLLVEIAILVALGHHFTLFHLVSLILVFGLDLDYALFFTREEPAVDKQKTFYGLLICAFSSILIFGILALSKIPVLHIIGMTTALGVLLAFFFSMLMTSLVLKHKAQA
ncbi:MAG: hypothetical protein KAU21_21015, partial [Gammaproteobacteria bacterium]|nr:hypothetical protein [Gammaproteobacteria bacterium]